MIQKSNEKSYEKVVFIIIKRSPTIMMASSDKAQSSASMHEVVFACKNCEPPVIYQKSTEENH